jgi:hypothetical protein
MVVIMFVTIVLTIIGLPIIYKFTYYRVTYNYYTRLTIIGLPIIYKFTYYRVTYNL